MQLVTPRRVSRPGARRFLFALALSCCATAFAFDQLAPAQALVYQTRHLANTGTGDELAYRYTRQEADLPQVQDRATLDIVMAHDDDRRDVHVDFLTGERHLTLPDFQGWRGNPILLAMLEHVAQELSVGAGGGALYFRNRIRDAMAGDGAVLDSVSAAWQGEQVAATRLHFRPFEGDAYLGARRGYAGTEFELVFSDAVPGGVLSVQVDASDGDTLLHRRTLQLSESER